MNDDAEFGPTPDPSPLDADGADEVVSPSARLPIPGPVSARLTDVLDGGHTWNEVYRDPDTKEYVDKDGGMEGTAGEEDEARERNGADVALPAVVELWPAEGGRGWEFEVSGERVRWVRTTSETPDSYGQYPGRLTARTGPGAWSLLGAVRVEPLNGEAMAVRRHLGVRSGFAPDGVTPLYVAVVSCCSDDPPPPDACPCDDPASRVYCVTPAGIAGPDAPGAPTGHNGHTYSLTSSGACEWSDAWVPPGGSTLVVRLFVYPNGSAVLQFALSGGEQQQYHCSAFDCDAGGTFGSPSGPPSIPSYSWPATMTVTVGPCSGSGSGGPTCGGQVAVANTYTVNLSGVSGGSGGCCSTYSGLWTLGRPSTTCVWTRADFAVCTSTVEMRLFYSSDGSGVNHSAGPGWYVRLVETPSVGTPKEVAAYFCADSDFHGLGASSFSLVGGDASPAGCTSFPGTITVQAVP